MNKSVLQVAATRQMSGIPVSENTGLYVALSPEAQNHLRKKSINTSALDENSTGLSVSITKPTNRIRQTNHFQTMMILQQDVIIKKNS